MVGVGVADDADLLRSKLLRPMVLMPFAIFDPAVKASETGRTPRKFTTLHDRSQLNGRAAELIYLTVAKPPRFLSTIRVSENARNARATGARGHGEPIPT